MGGSVNKCILVGNLGRDPEIKTFQNGDKIVRFQIATTENWKDKETGERREKTEWHRIEISNSGIAKIAEKYLRKGSKVYLEGKLETQEYTDRDGNKKYSTVVALPPFRGELTMLDGQKGEAEPEPEPARPAANPRAVAGRSPRQG